MCPASLMSEYHCSLKAVSLAAMILKKKKPPIGIAKAMIDFLKSPQQKKRKRCLRLLLLTGGCAALLSRFFSLFLRRLRRLLFLPSPRFSLLLWAAAPPHSPPRSRGRLAPPPRPPLLHYEIASLRDAHGDRCSSIPRLRKSEIFLSGVIEIEPLRGLFCYRHMS